MSDQPSTSYRLTHGGITGEHVEPPAPVALVAPARAHQDKEHNALRSSVVPFACWRAHDLRFAFDSSFVLPELAAEVTALKILMDQYTVADPQGNKHQPVLSVFGHADPTGSDDFNKALSGRRAQAIYALLTRRVDLWEDLCDHPHGNDKWDPDAIQIMKETLGNTEPGRPTGSARHTLFEAYMDMLCRTTDDKGNFVNIQYQATDFLAGGADSKGKGDYQGCSEFNPLLIFSAEETRFFAEPSMKKLRDLENSTNRRVVVFLFRPGVQVRPSAWPCPRAKEGVDGCKKRFWSDGETRRQPQESRRGYVATGDTFGCRFYDRLANRSPCEQEVPPAVTCVIPDWDHDYL